MEQVAVAKKSTFTPEQVLLIVILTVLQFTHALDFMIISPLGAMLIRLLDITPAQFGFVVSAYTFSAGAAGLVSASIADKFDRKKLLMFFYTGFVVGTFLCGLAPTYGLLLAARIIAGAFGGVLFAITLTIIGDVFPPQVRGRAMGVVQMSFSVSQIAGIPIGLYIANKWGWHMPFMMIGLLGIVMLVVVARWVPPIDGHLRAAAKREYNAFAHLKHVVSMRPYLIAFAVTSLLSITGFVVIPYMSTFIVHNVGIPETELPLLYLIAGITGIVVSPVAGKLSDSIGAYKVYFAASFVLIAGMLLFTNLSHTTLLVTACVNVFLMAGVMGRMAPAMALLTSVPSQQDRGTFMSINSSVQQIAAGLAAVLGGLIVQQQADGSLAGFNILGYFSAVVVVVGLVGLYVVHRYVSQKNSAVADA